MKLDTSVPTEKLPLKAILGFWHGDKAWFSRKRKPQWFFRAVPALQKCPFSGERTTCKGTKTYETDVV
ncbi:MAG TPA: hypothetical protein VMT24_05455 [Aggregatilineaceae bacterium]|nr:hypothetical protein [Aggregatilineaceae bacterium]